MSSIASGRVSANIAVSSCGVSARPWRARSIAPGTRLGAIGVGGSVRPEPLRGMNDQYLTLIVSMTPWARKLGSMYCG